MPELADIFRTHGPEYIAKFKDRMPTRQLDVIRDVVSCRTEALGGQLYHCPQCDDLHYRYHSCKNRHTKLFGISLDSEQLCYTNVSPDYRFNPKVQVPAPVLIPIQTLVADKDGCRQSITYLCRQVL